MVVAEVAPFGKVSPMESISLLLGATSTDSGSAATDERVDEAVELAIGDEGTFNAFNTCVCDGLRIMSHVDEILDGFAQQ